MIRNLEEFLVSIILFLGTLFDNIYSIINQSLNRTNGVLLKDTEESICDKVLGICQKRIKCIQKLRKKIWLNFFLKYSYLKILKQFKYKISKRLRLSPFNQ